jgi:hypothetical protein
MTYKVNRAEGYQPWGVTNPWVFADLSQPQRQRGRVSPLVYKTHGSFLHSPHLGQTVDEERERAMRMERYALIGLALSAVGFAFTAWNIFGKKSLKSNSRRRRR